MSNETKPKAKRRPPIALIVLAVGLVAYGGYRLYLQRKPYEWSGTVEARTISVGSRAGGRVAKVLVHEGDAVAAGQAIIELEPGDFQAQLLQANAQRCRRKPCSTSSSEAPGPRSSRKPRPRDDRSGCAAASHGRGTTRTSAGRRSASRSARNRHSKGQTRRGARASAR